MTFGQGPYEEIPDTEDAEEMRFDEFLERLDSSVSLEVTNRLFTHSLTGNPTQQAN